MLYNETAAVLFQPISSNGGPVPNVPLTDLEWETSDDKIFTVAHDPDSVVPNAMLVTGVAVGKAIIRAHATATQQRGMSVQRFEAEAEVVLLERPPVPGHPLIPAQRSASGPATAVEFVFGRPVGAAHETETKHEAVQIPWRKHNHQRTMRA